MWIWVLIVVIVGVILVWGVLQLIARQYRQKIAEYALQYGNVPISYSNAFDYKTLKKQWEKHEQQGQFLFLKQYELYEQWGFLICNFYSNQLIKNNLIQNYFQADDKNQVDLSRNQAYAILNAPDVSRIQWDDAIFILERLAWMNDDAIAATYLGDLLSQRHTTAQSIRQAWHWYRLVVNITDSEDTAFHQVIELAKRYPDVFSDDDFQDNFDFLENYMYAQIFKRNPFIEDWPQKFKK